jgi:predicted ribosome quality control (RQC) complex YloA/Tae2 family protein
MNVLLLKAWLAEEGPALIGARLSVVRQHDKRSLLLDLAGESGAFTLLLSVLEEFPTLAVVHGDEQLEESAEPESNFAKALNFHLSGYRLASIEQAGFDRSVLFTFRQRDSYGEERLKVLRHELVGRSSNAFLISERGMVVSTFKRVRREQNRVRQVITGKALPDPPPLNKFIAASADADELAGELAELAGREGLSAEGTLEGFFTHRVAGCDVKLWPALEPLLPVEYDLDTLLEFISRLQRGELTAQLFELAERGDANRLALASWRRARRKRGLKPSPTDVERDRAAVRLDQLREQQRLAERADEVEQLALEILKQSERIDQAGEAGEYIARWMKAHPAWAEQVSPAASVYDNAQELVHYAQRLRRGQDKLDSLVKAAEAELTRIERGTPSKPKRKARRDPLAASNQRLERGGAKFLRFISSDGFTIVCGVNDKSNDALLREFGSGRHLWLHARDYAGSHVIVLSAGAQVPPQTLEEAALVAAWHSQGRKESELEVSYLPLKHVRRVKGGKPGQVLKTSEKVISVRPARFEAIRDRLHYSGEK